MNKKTNLFLGIVILVLGVSKIINMILPSNILIYILNYQVFLMLLGGYLIVKKGIDNILGISVLLLGIYLYVEEFLTSYYTRFILPIVLILVGGFIIYKYFNEEKLNKKDENKGE